MEDFIHLHVHTHYSILDGQSKVANLVKKAVGDGMRGMAITDHGVMYGVKELADCCAKVNKERKAEGLEPFKPIFSSSWPKTTRDTKTLLNWYRARGWTATTTSRARTGPTWSATTRD